MEEVSGMTEGKYSARIPARVVERYNSRCRLRSSRSCQLYVRVLLPFLLEENRCEYPCRLLSNSLNELRMHVAALVPHAPEIHSALRMPDMLEEFAIARLWDTCAGEQTIQALKATFRRVPREEIMKPAEA